MHGIRYVVRNHFTSAQSADSSSLRAVWYLSAPLNRRTISTGVPNVFCQRLDVESAQGFDRFDSVISLPSVP